VRRLLHRADGKACDEPVDKEIIDDCDRHARDQANGCRTRCARGSRVGPSKTCLHQVILRETHAEQSVFRLTPEGGPPICASMLKTMRDPAQRRRDPVLDFASFGGIIQLAVLGVARQLLQVPSASCQRYS
jgi:hypothetical protein